MAENRPSLFGDDRELTYRAAMLPMGTYRNDDGSESVGWAWPGMISEPYNAFSRLAQNSITEDGSIGIPNPQNPDNQRDVLTGLLSFYGGNALNAPLRNAMRRTADVAPETMRAYRGVGEHGNLVPEARGGRSSGAVWASDSPQVASGYAGEGSVAPIDMSFANPMRVDAEGSYWSQVPFEGRTTNADVLARVARMRGHDGLILDNVIDNFGLGDHVGRTVAAVRPNTVRSATTGETLFSDTGRPSLFGSALAAEQDPKRRPSFFDF